jgi:integrase
METRLSITKDNRNKDSPWACRWYEPTDPDSGKRRRRCRSFLTKQEAKTFAAELRLERPAARVSGGITLGQHCRDWLKLKSNKRPTTLLCYTGTVERLLAHFGDKCKLADIMPDDAQEFITGLVKVSKEGVGEPVSIPTRMQHLQNANTLFNDAARRHKLRENPFADVEREKFDARRFYRLTPAEFKDLVDAASDLQTKCLYALLYTAGLRRSEAISLRWCDIDFEKGRVLIASRKGTEDLPPFDIKGHAARAIPLPTFTLNLLTTWQAQAPEGVPFVLLSKERCERIKVKWQQLRNQGKPWLNRYWTNNTLRNFKAHVKRAGIIPDSVLTIHTLRKNAAQNWADCVPMNVVKEWMGHADISTTMEFYSQVSAYHERLGVTAIQNMLNVAEQKAGEKDVCDTYEPSPATEKGQ